MSTRRAQTEPRTLGGKAENLARLTRAGLPVPRWFALPAEWFAPLAAGLTGELGAAPPIETLDRAALSAYSARLRERVHAIGLTRESRDELLAQFDAELGAEAEVAVRSSAVGEDSAADSFAGQLDTFLYVRRDALEARVLDCFASAWSERALLYRRLRSQEPARALDAAVIVQQMVASRVSGILFTANPVSGQLDEAVISAGLGLGEGIVGGLVEADTFYCALATGEVRRRELAEKRGRVVRARAGGTAIEPVAAEEGDRPALGDAQLAELTALGRKVQSLANAPQDIEWAIDASGRLHLLQTRPITTLGERESLFDNANIVESYPGLSSPLTFSFARGGYEVTFRESMRLFGVPEALLVAHADVHANLVALLDGRIYYNLLNWYRLFQLVPGFEWALPAWERALGLDARKVRRPPASTSRFAAAKVYAKVLWHFFRLEREIADFFVELESVQRDLDARDLATLEAHQLVDLVEEVSRRIMRPYAISVLNDSFGQQLHEILGKLIAHFRLGDPGLRNQLLCGEAGMESVEAVRSLVALAERVRATSQLRALFETATPAGELWERIAREPGLDEFRAQLDEHLRRYGDRTLQELKLETPSASADPTFLVAMLRNYLAGGLKVAALDRREAEIRERAETEVARRLRFSPLKRALFRWALRRTRASVRSRENLRLARSRAFGMVKRLYRALAKRLVQRRALDAEDDLFYLTAEELAGFVRGHAVTSDLRALVALRRREWAEHALADPPARLSVRGMVGLAPRRRALAPDAESATTLRGLGCGSGQVTAPAKVILDPTGDLTVRGEILVAPMTDPGWVFLMVAASGLIVEKGSLLSHTAIIGRELGIPTVVGVKDATRRIRDGERVTLDGDAGTVSLAGQSERP